MHRNRASDPTNGAGSHGAAEPPPRRHPGRSEHPFGMGTAAGRHRIGAGMERKRRAPGCTGSAGSTEADRHRKLRREHLGEHSEVPAAHGRLLRRMLRSSSGRRGEKGVRNARCPTCPRPRQRWPRKQDGMSEYAGPARRPPAPTGSATKTNQNLPHE